MQKYLIKNIQVVNEGHIKTADVLITNGRIEKIAISTNGQSPTLAKRIREMLEEAIPENINDLLENLNDLRKTLKGDFESKVRQLNEITKTWNSK